MKVSVRQLRDGTARVIDAVGAGETVTLTVHGEPVADIVSHHRDVRRLSGDWLRVQLAERAADPGLRTDLHGLAGGDDRRDGVSRRLLATSVFIVTRCDRGACAQPTRLAGV